MKILNVNMSIDTIRGGGTAERTVEMSKAFVENGHQCAILTLDLGITESRKNELKDVELVALPCLIERFFIPVLRLNTISDLVQSADIVHLMGHWTFINAITYYYIRKFKKKYVVCPAGALPLFGRSRHIKKIYNFLVGKKIIQNADAQIVITPGEASQFIAYGTTEENIVWIPNGINPNALQSKNDDAFRTKYNIGSAPFILFIGRLNLIKGPDLLLEAFAQIKLEFPEYHLVMAGPDEGMLNSLRNFTKTHNIENRVHFIGHISGEDKSQGLHAASLMVIPSRQEAMSIVVLEAGIAALPVILTDQCGLNNLGEIGAGTVVNSTSQGIRKGLTTLLEDPAKSKDQGVRLRDFVFKNYLWSSVIKKLESLYLKILKT